MSSVGFPVGVPPLDKVLSEHGRIGGPTPHGWHTFEPMFSCWRMYHLGNTQPRQEARTDKALAVGILLHELLAIYYKAAKTGGTYNDTQPAVDTLLALVSSTGYQEEAAETKRLYDGYRKRYEGNDGYISPSVRIVAVEDPIRRDFPWGDPYTIRLDLVLQLPDGYWIADHKTTWGRSTEFIEGWQIDPSVLGMLWAAQEKYSPLRGASINGVIKTKEPDYDRFTFAYDTRIVADWLRMMEYKSAERRIAALAGWPPNFKACFGKYRKCGYFEQCVYGVEASGRG